MSEVPATRAIIVPPPGGPSVVAVLQRSYQNGLSQEIALSTASLTTGQNAFYVSLLNNTADQSRTVRRRCRSRPLTQDRLQSGDGRADAGRRDADVARLCPEQVRPLRLRDGPVVQRATSASMPGSRSSPTKPPSSCRAARFLSACACAMRTPPSSSSCGSCTASRLPAYYRQESWNPYGDPPPPPAQLGETDAPMYPLGLGSDTTTVRRRSVSGETRRVASGSAKAHDRQGLPRRRRSPSPPRRCRRHPRADTLSCRRLRASKACLMGKMLLTLQ